MYEQPAIAVYHPVVTDGAAVEAIDSGVGMLIGKLGTEPVVVYLGSLVAAAILVKLVGGQGRLLES